jgi:steroid delta-isomerase-like uncharacterized protein
MTAAENKAMARRGLEELFVRGNLDALGDFMAQDAVDHNPPPGLRPGLEGARAFFAERQAAFPDMQVTLEDLVAEGDRVVARYTMRGTHRGPFLGVPATGREVRIEGIDILRLAGGKVVERLGLADALGLMQQLGAIPGPVGAGV